MMALSRRTALARLAAPTLAALACGDGLVEPALVDGIAVPPREAAALQTDRTDYVVRYTGGGTYASAPGDWVLVTYVNRSGAPVYLDRCTATDRGPLRGVGPADPSSAAAGLEDLSGPPLACVGVTPLAVAPGEARRDSLYIVLQDYRNRDAPRFVGRAGLYRVYYRGYRTLDTRNPLVGVGRDPLPPEATRSNAFRVRFEAAR
jgi:hypothetical protein